MEFVVGAILICLLLIFIFKSIKIVIKFAINILAGALVLYLFNLIAGSYGLAIAINPVTSFLTGFLGLPFVIVLIIMKIFV